MNILIFLNAKVPALQYGGTERVVYYLAQELIELGHNVTLLIKGITKEINIPYILYNEQISFSSQVPQGTDIVHCHSAVPKDLNTPYVFTMHGNPKAHEKLDKNTIFVSKNHALRHGSDSYVHNGLKWSDYGEVDLENPGEYYHFLGKAAWKVKNIKGAINIIKQLPQHLKVLGGIRFNFKMGLRFTLTPKVKFYGMVGGEEKNNLLRYSKGLIFPVRWHEPFGLAIIESLYFGAAVFGTPYGSLPEIVTDKVGFLSNNENDIVQAIKTKQFSRYECHEYALKYFNSQLMAERYLEKYEQVLQNKPLNTTSPSLLQKQKSKYLDYH